MPSLSHSRAYLPRPPSSFLLSLPFVRCSRRAGFLAITRNLRPSGRRASGYAIRSALKRRLCQIEIPASGPLFSKPVVEQPDVRLRTLRHIVKRRDLSRSSYVSVLSTQVRGVARETRTGLHLGNPEPEQRDQPSSAQFLVRIPERLYVLQHHLSGCRLKR